VLPNGAVDVLFKTPGLRREFDNVGLYSFPRDGFEQLPAINRILRGDKAVQRVSVCAKRTAPANRGRASLVRHGFVEFPLFQAEHDQGMARCDGNSLLAVYFERHDVGIHLGAGLEIP